MSNNKRSALIQSAKHHVATVAPHVRKRQTFQVIIDLVTELEKDDEQFAVFKRELDEAWMKDQMCYDTQGINWLHNQVNVWLKG